MLLVKPPLHYNAMAYRVVNSFCSMVTIRLVQTADDDDMAYSWQLNEEPERLLLF